MEPNAEYGCLDDMEIIPSSGALISVQGFMENDDSNPKQAQNKSQSNMDNAEQAESFKHELQQ